MKKHSDVPSKEARQNLPGAESVTLFWLLFGIIGLLDGLQNQWAKIAILPVLACFFLYVIYTGWRDYRWKWVAVMGSAVLLAFIASFVASLIWK